MPWPMGPLAHIPILLYWYQMAEGILHSFIWIGGILFLWKKNYQLYQLGTWLEIIFMDTLYVFAFTLCHIL